MNTYIILRRNLWSSSKEMQAAGARSNAAAEEMAADVVWLRTYVLAEEGGALGAICVYRATSEDKVREHSACAGLPADEIILVGDTVLVHPDPVPNRSAQGSP